MPDRQTGRIGDAFHEVEQRVDVVELGMRGGADAVTVLRHTADRADLLGDLRGGQHAAEAGLGALAELDLDRSNRVGGDGLDDSREVEVAVGVAGAEVPAPELPDQLAALLVVRGDPTLAGVVEAARNRRSLVQRRDRIRRQRPEAHRRHVDHRRRTERLGSATRGSHHLGDGDPVLVVVVGFTGERRTKRERCVLDDEVVRRGLQVSARTEREVVVLLLR